MRLFDQLERAFTGPAKYSESSFDFLNRSARDSAKAVRTVLEECFHRFPAESQADLRGRLRSSDGRQSTAAFYELYLHEVARRLTFEIEPHPIVSSSNHHLDFKLTKRAEVYYLEVTAAGPSNEDFAAARRISRVYDTLDRMNSPNFFVGVELQGAPETDPPGARIREFLARELARLNPDDVARDFDRGGLDVLPRWQFHHEGWDIVFSPIPKRPESRGKPGLRPLGFQMTAPEYVQCRESIVAAIESKANLYGELDHPYVIAVNVLHNFVDDDEIMDALFGQEATIVTPLPGGQFRTAHTRQPNGGWHGPTGPRATQVSAALMIDNFSHWDIARRAPVLWHNPWARRPLSPAVWPFEQTIGDRATGRLDRLDAKRSPHRFFELPRTWPARGLG